MATAKERKIIRCIYCTEERPASREHVLPRSLGGNCTAPIICDECNNRLSTVDAALATGSIMSLTRAGATPRNAFPVRVGGEQYYFDKDVGVHFEMKIENEFRPAFLPQVHIIPKEGTLDFQIRASSDEDLESLCRHIDRHLERGTLRGIHVKVGPSDRCETAHLVMHRKRDSFVRVPEPGMENQLFDFIEANWQEIRDGQTDSKRTEDKVEQPYIEAHTSISFDDVFRGVAKITFNVLAMIKGNDFALMDEFDPIRKYITGEEIVHDEDSGSDLLVDDRFVQYLAHGTPHVVPTESHAVTLLFKADDMTLYGMVTLYKNHSYIVSLGSLPEVEDILVTYEFSTDRTVHGKLDLVEAYQRLRTAKSEP